MNSVALSILTFLLPALAPAVATAQEASAEPAARLRLARFEIETMTPGSAIVAASYEFADGAPVVLTMVRFDGQRLVDLRLRDADGDLRGAFDSEAGRIGRLRLPAVDTESRSLYVDYRIELPAESSNRYPLPVPEAAADPAGSLLTIEVLLPPGAVYHDDGFPGFTRAGERDGRTLLRARVAGVPSFVHVVWGAAGDPLPAPRVIQGVVLAVVLALIAAGVLATRRRARRAEGGR